MKQTYVITHDSDADPKVTIRSFLGDKPIHSFEASDLMITQGRSDIPGESQPMLVMTFKNVNTK